MSDIVERLNQRAAGDANSLWTSAVDHIMALRAERNSARAARADLAEALEALRAIIGCGPHTTGAELDNVLIAAHAILSKHPKPERGAT